MAQSQQKKAFLEWNHLSKKKLFCPRFWMECLSYFSYLVPRPPTSFGPQTPLAPTHHQHSTRWWQLKYVFIFTPENWGKIFTHFDVSHLFSDGLVRKTTHQPSQRISPRKPAASDRRFWRYQMPMYKGEFQRAAKRRPIREAGYLDPWWTDQRAYNLLINGGFFVGVKSPTLPTFDPNLLGHPSMLKMWFCLAVWVGREFFLFSLNYQF